MGRDRVRRLLYSTLLASWLSGGFITSTVARDLNVSAAAPLERVKVYDLDRANGIGPRFRFASAPSELSSPCAASVGVNVNDANYIGYPGGERTFEEFRAKAAAQAPISPSEAEKALQHVGYTLKGEGPTSNAMCVNLFVGANGRGFCTGALSGQGYTIVYNFDPVACHYDNVAVATSIQGHLSVDSQDDQEPQLDCATKLRQFVTNIDDVLAGTPRDILVVHEVLNRHFPLHGCTVDVVSSIVKTSRYFRSMSQNGPRMHVFVLDSDSPHVSGVKIMFGITDTGDSDLPSAMWSRPSL